MRLTKKGEGSIFANIVAFFLLATLFLFIVGLFDLAKVEVYNPASAILKNQSLYFINDSNPIYLAMLENDNILDNTTLPFNLIFLFISFMAVAMSLYNSIVGYKTDPFSFLGKTTAGIIAFIYFLSVFLLEVVTWFIEQLINPIFGDVILNYVPSYQYLLNYPFIIVLVWLCVGIGLNQIFGKEEGTL